MSVRPAPPAVYAGASPVAAAGTNDSLVDLLDRLIDRGVVIQGDLVLAVAGVDLVHVGLRVALTPVGGSVRSQ